MALSRPADCGVNRPVSPTVNAVISVIAKKKSHPRRRQALRSRAARTEPRIQPGSVTASARVRHRQDRAQSAACGQLRTVRSCHGAHGIAAEAAAAWAVVERWWPVNGLRAAGRSAETVVATALSVAGRHQLRARSLVVLLRKKENRQAALEARFTPMVYPIFHGRGKSNNPA
jgi:hypothetical protein